ncbi:hypothetical protein U1Q18_005881 [Sarracenia purpurea var. burkii]
MVSKWVYFLCVHLLVGLLNVAEFSNGGITSGYVRKNDLSLDMPLDSDVFRIPPGYNSPQQVDYTVQQKVVGLKLNLLERMWNYPMVAEYLGGGLGVCNRVFWDLGFVGVLSVGEFKLELEGWELSVFSSGEFKLELEGWELFGGDTGVCNRACVGLGNRILWDLWDGWLGNRIRQYNSGYPLVEVQNLKLDWNGCGNYSVELVKVEFYKDDASECEKKHKGSLGEHVQMKEQWDWKRKDEAQLLKKKACRFDTKYYYEVGIGNTTRQFWFITPPKVGPNVPYTFGLIGDLGQTYDSNRTLTHYEKNPAKGQALLFVGDLSYADDYPFHDNTRWDTWGRFIERNAAHQPWIWTAGNHELDFAPQIGERKPFKPYASRFFVPFRASKSTSPLWYSIKRASSYIIVMSSYSAFGKYTPQYNWFKRELPKVNRTETPWLIVLMHSPIYNSYVHHYMEGETMRVMYESWFVEYKVDVVFAGHVHAYERSERVSNIAYNIVNGLCTPTIDHSAPVYITIGDGGNQEGLATQMTEPQPQYSAYREASFGHGIFDIKNRTHAYFSWHRNQDGFAVEADSLWFHNRYWKSPAESFVAAS